MEMIGTIPSITSGFRFSCHGNGFTLQGLLGSDSVGRSCRARLGETVGLSPLTQRLVGAGHGSRRRVVSPSRSGPRAYRDRGSVTVTAPGCGTRGVM
jgi:hypothetical protein